MHQVKVNTTFFMYVSNNTVTRDDLTVATCHIQFTFLSLCRYFSQENGQNTKVRYENGTGAQSIKCLIVKATGTIKFLPLTGERENNES